MFEIPFRHYPKVKNHNFYKDKILKLINEDDLTVLKDGKKCVKTDYFKPVTRHPTPYQKLVFEALNDYLNDFKSLNLRVARMWYQQSSLGQYHGVHNHGAIGLACVWYLEFNPKVHTGTNFIAPFADFLTGDAITNTALVEEGDFIVFPSYLLHQQLTNESEERRTIISMNLLPFDLKWLEQNVKDSV